MMNELFQQALNISSPWFIKSVEFKAENKRLDIYVDFIPGSTFSEKAAPEKAYKAYDTIEKTWRHLSFFEHECYLHARVPRVKRDDGKVRMIMPPWDGMASGFTLLFEALLLQLCKVMPVHNVAQLTKISDYKIWRMLDIYIDKAKSFEEFSDIKVVGMDETSVAKGHDYITLFVDLDERKTIHISKGKGSDTIKSFVDTLECKGGDRKNIRDVSCDMSRAFIKGVKEYLPEAAITFDKFHILKIINEGVDHVRRSEAVDNPLLKGTRYIFLKNTDNLTEKQKVTKERLSLPSLNLKSIRAMSLRESFQQIYQAETVDDFEALLKKWYYWATHSQLLPMVKVAKTIRRHWAGILRWKESQINNGILEGLNSVLQAAKRKARGYKKKHFMTVAYLLTGKLNFNQINNNCLPT